MFCVPALVQVCARAAFPYRQASWTQQATAGPGIGKEWQSEGTVQDVACASDPASSVSVR
jgi:hypothetical protein